MTDYPKVSVVTITYGHENYITQTFDGVLMQDYPGEIEFIIANDNSPDATEEVVRDYLSSRKIPNNLDIKYTRHAFNKGIMPNFMWALQQTSGKYIALCEGDDYWTDPLKLQKQVTFLENNEDFSICFHRVKQKIEEGLSYSDFDLNKDTKDVTTITDLMQSNFIHTPSVIFRNFNDFPEILLDIYPGDYHLHIINATHGKIKFLPEIMSVYRIHSGGVHSTHGIAEYIRKSMPSLKVMATLLKMRGFKKEAATLNKRYRKIFSYYYGIKNLGSKSKLSRTLIILRHSPFKSKLLFWKHISSDNAHEY